MPGRLSLALLLVAALFAGCVDQDDDDEKKQGDGEPTVPLPLLKWLSPVDLDANGYEPSIAVEASGALWMTAHKELNRPETWPYAASWIWVSRDSGKTWVAPTSPGQAHEKYVGDEGDIAVDGNDRVYFLDTYLADNHIHVWSDQGKTWEYSEPAQRSTLVDDRPWIAAQGDGIVHYLGNNGAEIGGGRHWYYRSTDGGLTFSAGTPVPGNGWAHIDADRQDKYAYIVSEAAGANAAGDIVVYVSSDSGATWDLTKPVVVATREGPGRQYPIVAVAPDGVVWVGHNDCGTAANCAGTGGDAPNRMFVSRSTDHGATWQTFEVTPEVPMFVDYGTVCAGPDGTVGFSYYATSKLPAAWDSEWSLYGGYAKNATNGTPYFETFLADNASVYTGNDLHSLHDFMECAVGPDGALNLAYQRTHGASSEDDVRKVWSVRGEPSRP